MSDKSILLKEYKKFTGTDPLSVDRIPISGSDRRYFRFNTDKGSVIGAYNPNPEENNTFINFTRHFLALKLPVPQIIYENSDENIYFLTDLGDTNLYRWLNKRDRDDVFGEKSVDLYKRIIDCLIKFQVDGLVNFDTDLCYPHRSFDRQSMVWDMNYFKYMFLKLVSLPFNEKRLEKDFSTLVAYLLEAGQDYFLYRDFQSANIMILNDKPWFIDYQGGRMGAAQYDIVSLLYDSKAHIPQQVREILTDYYTGKFCECTGTGESEFRRFIPGFSIIRLMQALGAYGYRGLYEQKPGFVQSIIPAVRDIRNVLSSGELDLKLPELSAIVDALIRTDKFDSLKEPELLTITINSFSYMNGMPGDRVHGGGYIFDCRGLKSPGKLAEFKDCSGLDQNVKEFIGSSGESDLFINDSLSLIRRSIDSYKKKNYTSLSVSFGSSGGQHRSVYCAEAVANSLRNIVGIDVRVNHRDLQS